MTINTSNVYNVYKKNANSVANVNREFLKIKQQQSDNIDKISISSKAVERNEIEKVSHSMAYEMESHINPRIQFLKQAVANDEYKVSSNELANVMLGILE